MGTASVWSWRHVLRRNIKCRNAVDLFSNMWIAELVDGVAGLDWIYKWLSRCLIVDTGVVWAVRSLKSIHK